MSGKKLKVMFVDDEPKILDGLRRKMRSMRDEWEMGFAPGGSEAKEMLMDDAWDVVVTDMRMPGITGQDLLTYVQDMYPQMLRIVLSGYSDREIIMQSTKTAHQYLSKPTSSEDIKSAIMRSMTLRKLLHEERLIKMASQLKNIPSIPSVYQQMMAELQKDTCSLKSLGEIIERDPGMSAKILQIVNSAFFGMAKHVETPSRAVIMLGLEIIRSLVLSIHLFESFRDNGVSMDLLNHLQLHAMNVANRAKAIATHLKMSPRDIDYSFNAGLLHDIGRLLLFAEYPAKYNEIIKISKDENRSLNELEMETFHASHSELGAYLIGIWGLQEPVIEAIAFHHKPSIMQHEILMPLACVHIANVIESINDHSQFWGPPSQYDTVMIKTLGLGDTLAELENLPVNKAGE